MSGVHFLLLSLGLVHFTTAATQDPVVQTRAVTSDDDSLVIDPGQQVQPPSGDAADRKLAECSHDSIKSCDKKGCEALKKDKTGRRGSWWQVELECRICGNNNPEGCNIESCAYMAKDHNTDSKKYGWIAECNICGVCSKGEKALGACAADAARSKDCPKPGAKAAVASEAVSLVNPSLTVLVLGVLATGLAM